MVYGANESKIHWRAAPALAARFAPTSPRCGPKVAEGEGEERDTYTFSQSPDVIGTDGPATVSVIEHAIFKGCPTGDGAWTIRWSAEYIPVSIVPPLTTNTINAATVAIFRRSLVFECRRVRGELTPLANAALADIAILSRGTPPSPADERAANDLARITGTTSLYSQRYYTEPLDPPAGPLEKLWLAYVNAGSMDLPYQYAQRDAVIGEMHSYATYERSGGSTPSNRALADQTFASSDAVYPQHHLQPALTALQHQLKLPAVCITPLDTTLG